MRAWERFLTGEPLAIAPEGNFVVASWLRSQQLGINPRGRAAPLAARGDAMAHLRHRHADLLGAASDVFANTAELFGGSRSLMLLTNAEGIVLDAVGDHQTLEQGQDIHLMRGGAWAEMWSGPTASAPRSRLRRPAQVHAAEHFCEGIKRWTCAAAPIFAPAAEVLGVVDISAPRHLPAQPSGARRHHRKADRDGAARARHPCPHAPAGGLSSNALGGHGRAGGTGSGRQAGAFRWWRARAGGPRRAAARPAPGPRWRMGAAVAGRLAAGMVQPGRHAARPSAPCWSSPPVHATPLHAPGSESDPRRCDLSARHRQQPGHDRLARPCAPLAARRVAVLIEGETGVGKEFFARLVAAGRMARSPSWPSTAAPSQRSCWQLNCSDMSAAPSPAPPEKAGRAFRAGARGHFSLDEIGEMPLDLQPLLLRVLEEGVIYRLGDSKPRPVDVRLVASTNRNLKQEVAEGRFRKDLYFRIGVVKITIPPLRERIGDVEVLIDHFNREFSATYGKPPLRFEAAAQDLISHYDWPGNVRELRNMVESLLLMSEREAVTEEEAAALLEAAPTRPEPVAAAVPKSAPGTSLEQAERAAITQAVRHCHGNLAEAARALRISRSTLYRKMERYDLAL